MKIIFFSILVFSLLTSKFALALNCYSIVNNEKKTSEIVQVSEIIIPESAENGQTIWTSPEYSREIMCDSAGKNESAYFYPFPNVDVSKLPTGMSFGIIYNGIDHEITKDKEKILTDIIVPKGGQNTGTIRIQLYIKKTGVITGGFADDLDLYQLDGEGGLNNATNRQNFRLSLSNLSDIVTGTCTYSWSGFSETNDIRINDDLILSGQTIPSTGNALVSCTPENNLKNRTVIMNLYTKTSSRDSLFKTDKDGLGYQLLISGNVITPSTSSSSPLTVSFILDDNGQGNKNLDQKVFLTSHDEDWIYQSDTTNAESNNPNLEMKVKSFE